MGFIPGKKKELMEIDDLFESISAFSFNKKILKEGVSSIDISGTSTFSKKKLPNDKYFILHHTAGRMDAAGVVRILNNRGLGVQWVIDREGTLYQTLPTGNKGAHVAHIGRSAPKDLSNSTSQGVEIVANDDTDILIKQCKTALLLIKKLGYSLSNIYGHGEVSTNKMLAEGKTCKAYATKYWNTPENQLPDIDTTLNTNVDDKKDNKPTDKKDNESTDKKDNESKNSDLKKNDTFCKCLSDEKNKTSNWIFSDAVKKCDPNTPIETAIALAKLCSTNDNTENQNKSILDLSITDFFGKTLKEERLRKNIEKIKKIL